MSDKNHKRAAESADKALAKAETPSWLQPFEDMDEWFDELQKRWLSHRFFGRGLADYPQAFGGRIPKVDVIDREKEICVHAELPGVTKDDLSVTLQDNILNIHASVEKEKKDEKGKYHRRELFKGEFQRTLQLPSPVDNEKSKATFKDGVLELILPKAANYSPKKIKVE
jgi:HSP20 family protein